MVKYPCLPSEPSIQPEGSERLGALSPQILRIFPLGEGQGVGIK